MTIEPEMSGNCMCCLEGSASKLPYQVLSCCCLLFGVPFSKCPLAYPHLHAISFDCLSTDLLVDMICHNTHDTSSITQSITGAMTL